MSVLLNLQCPVKSLQGKIYFLLSEANPCERISSEQPQQCISGWLAYNLSPSAATIGRTGCSGRVDTEITSLFTSIGDAFYPSTFAACVGSIAAFVCKVGAKGQAEHVSPQDALFHGRTGAQAVLEHSMSDAATINMKTGACGQSEWRLAGTGLISGRYDVNVKNRAQTHVLLRFREAPGEHCCRGSYYGFSGSRKKTISSLSEGCNKLNDHTNCAFSGLDKNHTAKDIAFGQASAVFSVSSQTYSDLVKKHTLSQSKWQEARQKERDIRNAYIGLYRLHRQTSFAALLRALYKSLTIENTSKNATPSFRCSIIAFQQGKPPFWRRGIIEIPPPPPPYEGDTDLILSCPVYEWGDVWFFLDSADDCQRALPKGLRPWRVRRRYTVMLHEILIKLLPDNLILPCESISVEIDIDSLLWKWSARTLNMDADNLVQNLKYVEIRLDDVVLRGLLEQYETAIRFADKITELSGRSLSAMLALNTRSRLEEEGKTAVQLAEDELYNTGWSLDWQTVDWLIPGGLFSYEKLSPLQAVSRLATAAGAFLLSDTANNILHVVPRFKTPFWELSEYNADIVIPTNYIITMSLSFEPGTLFNGVFVSGRNTGVFAKVVRSGTDGAPYADMVVDELITSTTVARERGRQILAGSGNRVKATIRTIFTPEIGVILPGEIVQITNWKGYVVSSRIEASLGAIYQTIVVDKPMGGLA